MGLINPAILAGLFAIAAPIAIHFIKSRKFQRVEIGSLRFLRVAVHERRRWRKIEEWPLLLSRIAAVVALTFLFARPFFPEREKVSPNDLEAILLVDVSGSMSGEHFDVVRAAARETVTKIPRDAKVTIAEFADDVREVKSVEALRGIPGAKTDYARAVNWAVDHIAQSERKNARVYLISDLQREAMPGVPPRVWPSNARVTVVRIPPAGKWNAGISKVELLTPFVSEEAVAEVTVSVTGEAPQTQAPREVEFLIEGLEPMKQTVDAAGGRAQFHWKPEKDGLIRGMAALASDDAYPVDNRRPFALALARPKHVLMVEGGTPLTPYEAESYFLEKALEVSGREGAGAPFDSRVQEDLANLEGVDAIAWCNASAPAGEAIETLKSFVEHGGAVAFVLGSRAKAESYAALASSGLFPGKMEEIESPVLRPIQTWDRTHEALKRFDGGDRGDLRSILLRDAFEIDGGADWQTLASLDNGHPVLLARTLGAGRVLVFANPLTRAWSDFPTQRIFLPLMKEWFFWLTKFNPESGAPRVFSPGLTETRAIGIYEKAGAVEVVAPDASEMDPGPADEAYTRRALGLPSEESSATVAEYSRLPKFRERQNEIWPWIALLLLSLLVFENILADQRTKARERVP